MKSTKESTTTNLISLATIALATAIIICNAKQQYLSYSILTEERYLISCGSLVASTNVTTQSQYISLSKRIDIPMNDPNGYGRSGDRNSCPHQVNQSVLWISSDRKNWIHSC